MTNCSEKNVNEGVFIARGGWKIVRWCEDDGNVYTQSLPAHLADSANAGGDGIMATRARNTHV